MEHRHHGKSSESFLDSDEILTQLNLEGDEKFLDAGCGDGYISKKAIDKYLPNGMVYAVDNYDLSIKDLEIYKTENNIKNLINIQADITEGIPIEDGCIDVLLMLNVFHGFKPSNQMDVVVEELKRVINDDGRIAIMDFKPIDMQKGPPLEVRCSPDELKNLFADHGLKMTYLNEEIGEDIPEGKSHYMIIFEKE